MKVCLNVMTRVQCVRMPEVYSLILKLIDVMDKELSSMSFMYSMYLFHVFHKELSSMCLMFSLSSMNLLSLLVSRVYFIVANFE